ncbi:MAG: B12-binding domain-containing radical SAM protein, partial [Candidatus Omnitrophica bacterium]|nr:B12-binding domain-containing radical SAM protein [Candidatus Omnitrophota bacterium]
VEILDCVRDRIDPEMFRKHIEDNPHYNLVGFSLFTTYVGAVKKYTEAIKQVNPKIYTTVGGPHAVLEPVETLEILTDVDFGFRGEAEIGICQLADVIATEPEPLRSDRLKDVDNLVWRDAGNTIVCNPRVMIDDLDSLPFPPWDIMNPGKYPLAPIGVFSKRRRVAPIIATRGCPYPCTFCAAGKMSGKKMRTRSVDNILEEIQLLVDQYGVEEINILDDNFTLQHKLVEDFCHGLIEKNIQINWSCPNGVRLDTLDADLLKLMERSGCYSFGVGIEWGTAKMLKVTRKCVTLETIREKVDLIKAHTDIRVTGFFMLGHPEENIEDVEATIDFACSLNIDRANFFNFSPFPGIVEYDKLKREGKVIKNWYDSLYINSVVYTPRNITRRELVELQRKAFWRFYTRPRIFFNILREIKSFSQFMVVCKKSARLVFVHGQ